MNNLETKSLQGILTLLIIGIGLILIASHMNHPLEVRDGIYVGIIIASTNGILSLLSILWSFNRSDKVFYGLFFGNMLWKILVLGITFSVLRRHPEIHTVSAMISLAILTLFINILELKFLPEPEKTR